MALQLPASSTSLLTGNAIQVSPEQAWTSGSNLRSTERKAPEVVRAWLASQVYNLVKFMDMNKTISTDEELQFCCRQILSDHPTLKLEEIVVCFDMIKAGKFGKMYERFKAPELLQCLREYEGEVRTPILENQRHMEKQEDKSPQMPWMEKVVNNLPEPGPDEPATIKEGVGARLKKTLG